MRFADAGAKSYNAAKLIECGGETQVLIRDFCEARLNQTIANLIEFQVARTTFPRSATTDEADDSSFGMLAAQAAVIISTLAMAARKRNLLWSIAAAAGLAAIAFAIYVYLRV